MQLKRGICVYQNIFTNPYMQMQRFKVQFIGIIWLASKCAQKNVVYHADAATFRITNLTFRCVEICP